MENDAKILETLVVKEDEPTSPKSHEKINDEVVKTILEKASWGEMHEELKNEKTNPIPKIEECTINLFKEMEATIVNKKIMILEEYVLKLLIEHNYRLLEKDGGKNCDAPKPGGPLTTRQPVENLYVSYHETHT